MLKQKKLGWIIGVVLICAVSYGAGVWQSKQKEEISAIPKIIHYCWFGDKSEPEAVRTAIASWKKFAPEFKIKRWNETNCNVKANPYVYQAYLKKDWMSVSDYCRIAALEKEGGLYLDTDNFMQAPIGPLLIEPLVLTLQNAESFSGSFIGTIPHHPLISNLKQWFDAQTLYERRTISSLITEQMYKMYPQWIAENVFQRSAEQFAIYPTNVLLIDFGGPENVIDHWYGRGRPFTEPSTYYYHYRGQFIDQETYQISDKEGTRSFVKNVVLLPQNKFYTVESKETGTYEFYTDNLLTLQWDIGRKSVYLCREKKCENTALKTLALSNKKQDRLFEEQEEYIVTQKGKIPFGTTLYLNQGTWRSWCLIVNRRLVNLGISDWGNVIEKTNDFIKVQWDNWGTEKFVKQKDGSYKLSE